MSCSIVVQSVLSCSQSPTVVQSVDSSGSAVIGEFNNNVQHDTHLFCVIISCVCSPTAVTVSVLVSGVVSAISAAIVTSIIVWCVMRRPPSPAGTGTADDDKGVTELATVIYDTPHVIKEHNDQSAISTQDNKSFMIECV